MNLHTIYILDLGRFIGSIFFILKEICRERKLASDNEMFCIVNKGIFILKRDCLKQLSLVIVLTPNGRI
jgi:hypothetical protein